MYDAYYGLAERPFDLNPNPRFLCMTPGHREALSTIEYGIAGRKGLTLVVGAAGTGKTTLVHAALDRSQGLNARPVCLNNPVISREEFFDFLAQELEVPATRSRSKPKFLKELGAALLKRREDGVFTALIVDEAQAMPDELLEEVRLLENLETSREKLLPVVLVGQLELAERLRQPHLLPLKQRIALRSTLPPLSARESATYVAERIRIAGGDVATMFSPEAVAAICEAAAGIPRTISVVCDNALVAGFALDERPVGLRIVAEVCRDFDLPTPGSVAKADAFMSQVTAWQQAPPVSEAPERTVSPAAPQSRPALPAPDERPPRPRDLSPTLGMSEAPPAASLTIDLPPEDERRRVPLGERIRAWRSLITRVAHR